MKNEKPGDRLKRKYYLRLLEQRRSLVKVISEIEENINQIDREISYIKSFGFVSAANGRLDEKSYFHLERPVQE